MIHVHTYTLHAQITHTHTHTRTHTHTLPCPALYLGTRKQVGEGSPKHFDDHVQIPQVLRFLHDEVLHNLLIGHGLSPDGLILYHHRRHILFLREHVYQHLGGRESRRYCSHRMQSIKVVQLQSNHSGIITVAYIYKVRRCFSCRMQSVRVIQLQPNSSGITTAYIYKVRRHFSRQMQSVKVIQLQSNHSRIIIIITYSYKVPFPTGAHSILPLLTVFATDTNYTRAIYA